MRRETYQRQTRNRRIPIQSRGQASGRPPNFGSARSDYGELAYGGRLNKQGMDRDWWDRATDEVSSWFGDEEAERRRRMDERREAVRRQTLRSNYRDYQSGSYPIESAYNPANVYVRDWHNTGVRDVMTRNITTVHPNDSVIYAARLMADCDCGAIPVVDWHGRMIGMITDRDIAVRLVANGVNPAYAQVGDFMTAGVFACHQNDSLENCMRSMARHQIRRMPIVDDHNRVVGIISQADIAEHAEANLGTSERQAVADVVAEVSEPSYGSYR